MYSSRLGGSFRFAEFGVLPVVAIGVMPSSLTRRSAVLALGYGADRAGELFFVKSPRWRKDGGGDSRATFFNKYFCILALCGLLLLLACRGGVGERKRGAWRRVCSSYPGGEANAPLEWEDLPLAGASWWRTSATDCDRCCLNNCSFRVGASGFGAASLLRRGGCGEEEVCSGLVALREAFQAAASGVHQWRQASAVVSFGQGGRSRPWCSVCHGAFNLQADVPLRRPLLSSPAAFIVPPSPSGIVPGDGADGCSDELIVFLGGEGLNCVPKFLCRVLFVKSKGLVLFLFYFMVLDVICTPTV